MRGSQAKEEIITKLLEVFPGAFKNDKEIRIPMTENGEEVQIKVALTCAKENIKCAGIQVSSEPTARPQGSLISEITAQEKVEVDNLIQRLGL